MNEIYLDDLRETTHRGQKARQANTATPHFAIDGATATPHHMSVATAPVTVVEVSPFPTVAASVWSEEEKAEFIDYIARNPRTGAVIPGTGGIRKVRWTRAGIGKRGGVRVIYFYHSEATPVFLLTVYAKSQRENLTEDQKRTMARNVDAIIAGHTRRGTP